MIWIFAAVVLGLLVHSSGFRRFSAWLAGAAVIGAIITGLVMYGSEQRDESLRAKQAAEYQANVERQAQADSVAAAEAFKAQQDADAARAAQEAREAPERARRARNAAIQARAAQITSYAEKVCESELNHGPARVNACIRTIAENYQKMDAAGLSAIDWKSIEAKCFVYHHYQSSDVDVFYPWELAKCVDSQLEELRK